MADEAANGGAAEGSEEPASPSLEDLQRQLAEMEATQSELASRLEAQTQLMEPQLDSRLAVIEEQFRQNFDDRLREGAAGVRRGSADSGDVLLTNRVFREVSRYMADEWRPVFDALMSTCPLEDVDKARHSLQQHPPLIQVSSLSFRFIQLYKLKVKVVYSFFVWETHRGVT